MSPKLAIVGLSIVPPVAGMAIMYGRYVRNITKKVQDSLASATQVSLKLLDFQFKVYIYLLTIYSLQLQVAEERISNIRTVRAFSQEGLENRVYHNRIEEVMQLAYKEALAKGVFFGMASFASVADVLSQ